jgi:hypothetical protein
MGLKDQIEFETEVETTTATTEENQMNTETKTQDAGVSATTAIAAAATGSAVAAHKPATKLVQAFSDKHGVFDVATVEGLSIAVPRLKGEQGSIFQGDSDLGESITFEIVSISPRWIISTGTDDKEAKEYFKVSYDGRTISGTSTLVEDYIEDLKARGFDKAEKATYLDIFGFVVSTAKKGEIPVDARELSCLQCSKTSMGAFTAFATTRGLLESRGIAKPLELIQVQAMKRTAGTNKYTNFQFTAPKA